MLYFNPRSPHRERPLYDCYDTYAKIFQSTLPSQGATYYYAKCFYGYYNFNPRSPHRERRRISRAFTRVCYFNPRSPHRERLSEPIIKISSKPISIHAPLTGSDTPAPIAFWTSLIFQSTLPSQGATSTACFILIVPRISIHAPLTGSDGMDDA